MSKLKLFLVILAAVLCFLTAVVPAQIAQNKAEAERLMQEITGHLNRKEFKEVIAKSNRILELFPNSGEIYSTRAMAYMVTGEAEKALADFEKSLELGVNDKLKMAGYKMITVLSFRFAKYEKTINAVNEITKTDKTDFRDYMWRAWAYHALGKNVEAVVDYDTALKLSPTEPKLRQYRAEAFYDLGKFEKVVEEANEELKNNPKPTSKLFDVRAKAYRKLGKIDLAEADEKKAAELAQPVKAAEPPQKQQSAADEGSTKLTELVNSASKKFENREWLEAISIYNSIFELIPSDDENAYAIFFSRGRCFYELEKYDEAFRDYNEVIKRQPDLAGGYTFRGEVYLRKNNFEAAIKDFNQAIKLDSVDVLAYRRRGEAFYNQKKYVEAVTDMTKTIEIDPKFTSAWFWRAEANFEIGDFRAALGDINEYIKLENADPDAFAFRSKVHRKLKDEKSAAADEKTAEGLKKQ